MEQREAFVRAQQPGLIRAAYLLTGDDTAAQDLAQETLVKVLLHWQKVVKAELPAAYVQRILLNTFLASRRRSWIHEEPHAAVPEAAMEGAYERGVANRDLLARALRALPSRQRAALVLRYYYDQSETQAARTLGCSVGNIKSLTSRGLLALRAQLSGATL